MACNVSDIANETLDGQSGTSYNISGLLTGCHGDTTAQRPPFIRPTVEIGSIIMVMFYGLICVVGLVGNGLVIFVITRYTKMKTVTNMYILNLSIADTIFLLGLPLIMTTAIIKHWIFGFAMCKIYFILTCINMFSGPFTLTVMSGDRFLAVCYPISSMRYRTSKYATIALVVTWLLSFLVMLPVVLYAKNVPNPRISGIYTCTIEWPSGGAIAPNKAYISYTLLLGFVVPVLLISLLYTLLVIRLRTSGPQVKSAEKKRSRRKVTRLVTLIIAVYFICWLPYWAFQVHLIVSNMPSLPRWQIYLYQVFTVLSYANSMVNPCLYAFTNDNFRESFINAFRCASDPILSGRRTSEMAGQNANNNCPTAGQMAPTRDVSHAAYEFSTIRSNNRADPDE